MLLATHTMNINVEAIARRLPMYTDVTMNLVYDEPAAVLHSAVLHFSARVEGTGMIACYTWHIYDITPRGIRKALKRFIAVLNKLAIRTTLPRLMLASP
jgi:hypothetical protein